ncbi:MAG: hypothetical protein GXO23_05835 [Crenarchaeota archaeon]|nr:hypothetical protein [Thermoproteota archaeon]
MNCRAQTSIATVIMVLCVVVVVSTLVLLLSCSLISRTIPTNETTSIAKISTSIEAYSELIYNRTSGYAHLLLRIINFGRSPVTISSVLIISCVSGNIVQVLTVPRKGAEILFRRTVVIKVKIRIPPIKAIKAEGLVNMSVLFNSLAVDSIEDSSILMSEAYIAFIGIENGQISLYNISIILKIDKSDTGAPQVIFEIYDNAHATIIKSVAVPLRYGVSYNFNITIHAVKTSKRFVFLREYNISFLGYLNGKKVIYRSFTAILGLGFFKGCVGCVPLITRDVLLTFNYVKVHYDSKTRIYYMKKIVEKYTKYVKVLYKWNSTIYPGKNVTIVIKFRPRFRIRPHMCYNLMIVSRSGAFWYVNYVNNRVRIVS